MASEDIQDMLENQSDLLETLTSFGQNISRLRPGYTDKSGSFIPPSSATYPGVVGVEKRRIQQLFASVGMSNFDNANPDDLLCPYNVDIEEGDTLMFNGYEWNVTKANPAVFTSQDIIVYWEFTLTRHRKVI